MHNITLLFRHIRIQYLIILELITVQIIIIKYVKIFFIQLQIANCQVLATVRENTKAKPKTICSRLEKESTIYTSLTNSVEIRITPNRMEGPSPIYFLLKYEGLCIKLIVFKVYSPQIGAVTQEWKRKCCPFK